MKNLLILLLVPGCHLFGADPSSPDDERAGNLSEDSGADPTDTQQPAPSGVMAPWLTSLQFPSPCGIHEYEVIDPVNQLVGPTALPWMEMQVDNRGFPSTQTFTRQDVSQYGATMPFSWEYTYQVNSDGLLTDVAIELFDTTEIHGLEWHISYTYAGHPSAPASALMDPVDTGMDEYWEYDHDDPSELHLSVDYEPGDTDSRMAEYDSTTDAYFDGNGNLTSVTYNYGDGREIVYNYTWDANQRLTDIEQLSVDAAGVETVTRTDEVRYNTDNIQIWEQEPGEDAHLRYRFDLDGDEISSRVSHPPRSESRVTRYFEEMVEGQPGYRTGISSVHEGPRPSFGMRPKGPDFTPPWTFVLPTVPQYSRFATPPEIPEVGYPWVFNTPTAVQHPDARLREWLQAAPTPAGYTTMAKIRYDDAGNVSQYWHYDEAGILSKVFHMDYACYANLVTGTMPSRPEDIVVPAP